MARASRADEFSARALFQQLGETWTMPLLEALEQHPWRYHELKERLGIASNMLSRTLRTLERNGFVTRIESLTHERQVEYGLTPLGVALREIARDHENWARQHRAAIVSARRAFDNLPRSPHGNPPNADPEQDLTPARVADSFDRVHMAMNHIAIVVDDIEATARSYAEVFNIEQPEILVARTVLPDTRAVPVRSCWIAFGNFWVNLIESDRDLRSFRRFIAKYGQGVHHIGFDVAAGVQYGIQALHGAGGERLMGDSKCSYAQFDFREGLGTGVELVEGCGASRQQSARNQVGTVGKSQAVSSVTITVPNIARTSRLYWSLLGLRMSEARTADFCYPSAAGIQRGQTLMGTVRHNGIAINVLQPIGASPLQAHVARTGGGVHHLGFSLQEPLDHVVAELERKGGRVLIGEPGKDHVQVDLSEKLGLVIALNRSKSRQE